MNLTNLRVTPLHVAFDAACRCAEARGLRVTGSELVGLIPRGALLDAGRHYLRKQQRSLGVAEPELLKIAVRSLGLDEVAPFNPEERVIEYRLERAEARPLARLTLQQFLDETASESVAPGGGSVAAAVGALGAALGTMVANLSAHKRGWDERWAEFSDWAERGQRAKEHLLHLVDDDTRAYNRVVIALGMPKDSEAERRERAAALEAANLGALEVPWQVMRAAHATFELLHAMAEQGNPASASDAGVGVLCARAAVRAAWLNVRTNASSVRDQRAIAGILQEGTQLEQDAARQEEAILKLVVSRFSP
jgi:glutamate formiminotransferase/formiminotetrahydrofolate cyclodeaminase